MLRQQSKLVLSKRSLSFQTKSSIGPSFFSFFSLCLICFLEVSVLTFECISSLLCNSHEIFLGGWKVLTNIGGQDTTNIVLVDSLNLKRNRTINSHFRLQIISHVDISHCMELKLSVHIEFCLT